MGKNTMIQELESLMHVTHLRQSNQSRIKIKFCTNTIEQGSTLYAPKLVRSLKICKKIIKEEQEDESNKFTKHTI